jgi:CxxC-x17-CxxC domain-containing protein
MIQSSGERRDWILDGTEVNHRLKDERGRELTEGRCAKCGMTCHVPFVPQPDRPVYCRKCWSERRRVWAQRR